MAAGWDVSFSHTLPVAPRRRLIDSYTSDVYTSAIGPTDPSWSLCNPSWSLCNPSWSLCNPSWSLCNPSWSLCNPSPANPHLHVQGHDRALTVRTTTPTRCGPTGWASFDSMRSSFTWAFEQMKSGGVLGVEAMAAVPLKEDSGEEVLLALLFSPLSFAFACSFRSWPPSAERRQLAISKNWYGYSKLAVGLYPPPFSYSELPRSFASAAHRANLANADQAGRFVSNQSPRTNAGSTTVPANEDLRTGNTLGISSVEYQGHSIWRVMPQYVPYSDTAEVQWQGDVQRFPEGLTAAIQKENDGLRLINKGNTGRIFKMGNDYRAYYVPGESSVLLHYAAVDNSGFMHVSIHKIPENQIIKTGAFDR
ncbi:uncharacterized protein SPSC_01550 [Sporisorium scitamineum]|uniref:Uncharacterized protein n=1 Tax=Sporisorium scitamineum TaxID=49012 RepID=A0A127Z9W3_9BASI|nr:uncharacterized protein SPSC_01550 [Sporisorium scitamineum]